MILTRRTNPKRSYSFKGRMKCFADPEKTITTPDKQAFSYDWLTKRKKILNKKKKRDYEILVRVFDTPKTTNIGGVPVQDKQVKVIEYLFAVEEQLTFEEMIMECLKQAWRQIFDEHEKTDFYIDINRSYAEVRC